MVAPPARNLATGSGQVHRREKGGDRPRPYIRITVGQLGSGATPRGRRAVPLGLVGSAHLMAMRRGLEASTLGSVITSTPSWKSASTLSVCTEEPRVKERVKVPNARSRRWKVSFLVSPSKRRSPVMV